MAAPKPRAQTPGPWGSSEACPHQTEQAPPAAAQPGALCDPGAQASQDQAGNRSQEPHGNALHPPIPNPPSLLLHANMAAPKSRSLQWFGAQQAAQQPRPCSPRGLWPVSRTHQSHQDTAPPCRADQAMEQFYRSASPVPSLGQHWLPVRARRRAPLAAVYGAAWLRFPANPPGDTGRSGEAHPGSHAQHCQAPACSPESAVTGRQRCLGHQRSQREGSRGASAAKGCRSRLTPAC